MRYPWHDVGDTPTVATLQCVADGLPKMAADILATKWNNIGFSFSSEHAAGELTWATARGSVSLRGDPTDRHVRLNMLTESLLTLASAWLVRHGGLTLHSAVLWLEGQVWLVSGPSTAGKTTLCARFPGRWWSDEYAFLMPSPHGWQVWRHREFRGGDGDFPWTAPLAGILWLGPERGHTGCEPMPLHQAFARLGHQLLTMGALTTQPALDALSHLLEVTPVRVLSHDLRTPAPDVAAAICGRDHA